MIDLPDQAFLLNAAARGVQWGFWRLSLSR